MFLFYHWAFKPYQSCHNSLNIAKNFSQRKRKLQTGAILNPSLLVWGQDYHNDLSY